MRAIHRCVSVGFVFVLAVSPLAGPADAQVPLDGYFITLRECPAYQSFRQETNPGNVTTVVDRAYPLYGKNAADATHYLVDVREASPTRRWVAAACGVYVVRVGAVPSPPGPTRTSGPAPTHTPGGGTAHGGDAVFAVSWQAAFCETRPNKPECTSMTDDRFDATHLTLHGLWPQGSDYCGISPAQQALDQNSHWDQLDPVDLTTSTRDALERVMPGTQSHLERHEWTKHGSCSGSSADEYFRDAVALVMALNESPVQAFLKSRIGTNVSTNDIRAKFDQAFGGNAGSRVAFKCATDGGRTILTEMRINVRGTIDETSGLGALMLAAPTVPRGCAGGVIDAAGLQ
jgi:ribonuclease T2